MKILFLTRKYPPSIGGMQSFSYNLVGNFKKINAGTFLIANRKGEKNLPFFLPYSFIKALLLIKKNKIEVLHLSDGLLSFLGYFLKKLTGVKVAITIHGLDIIYPNFFYQKVTPFFVKDLDLIICNSQATKEEYLKRGISGKKCEVIPMGIDSEKFILKTSKDILREKLSDQLEITFKNTKILLTVGRLVKRKGVVWFLDNVMPKLKGNYLYLVAGEGPEKEKIQETITKNNLHKRVLLLGKTNFETIKLLYNSADIFIMPNIKVKGDMEGFGIVALEAASCGLPVIASNLEGIKDAVTHQGNGFLVEPHGSNGFAEITNRLLENDKERKEFGEKARRFTKERYNWNKITKSYLNEFINLVEK